MKNLRYFLFMILITGTSLSMNGQFHGTVSGNGNVIKKERKAGSFNAVTVSSGINVFLKQADSESIVVEADENLHKNIITETRGKTLHVYSNANIRRAKIKRVYVTMREITALKTSSAGDLIGEESITAEKLTLTASSAGDIKLEVFAEEIKIDISSSGDITLSGNTDILVANISSAGDLYAYNLKAREADITVSSSGDADITVTESLKANASSAGDINYRGNPRFVDARSSSAGRIVKR